MQRAARGVHRLFRQPDRVRRVRRDASRQCVDERTELVVGQRAVHVAVALGQFGGEVGAAEHDLQGAAATDQPWQPLRPAAAGDDPERDLGLRQERATDGGEAEIEGEHELAAAAAGASLDLRDRHLRQGAPLLEDDVDEPELFGALGRVAGERVDQVEVGVRDEELRVRAAHDDDLHRVVAGQLAGDGEERPDQRPVEQVHRRVVDRHGRHARVACQGQARVLAHPGILPRCPPARGRGLGYLPVGRADRPRSDVCSTTWCGPLTSG